jgi:hypothetical protein
MPNWPSMPGAKTMSTSPSKTVRIEAEDHGSPEPYSKFLPYIEFRKARGMVSVKFGENNGLCVEGSRENLELYVAAFEFEENENGEHHHPEMSLIDENNFDLGYLWPFVEADNEYVEDRNAG